MWSLAMQRKVMWSLGWASDQVAWAGLKANPYG
jgi:hypothetical protein